MNKIKILAHLFIFLGCVGMGFSLGMFLKTLNFVYVAIFAVNLVSVIIWAKDIK